MKKTPKNIATVSGAILLFLAFSVMHEFDWLIPPSPVQTVASNTSVPVPDAIEEHGSEDEIEHDDSEPVFLPPTMNVKNSCMISRNLYVPSVATPPPDMI